MVSLIQYPKGIITRYLDGVDMIAKGKSLNERWAGVRLLVGLVVLAMVAQQILEKVTGESRYYDPDLKREVKYDPYSLVSIVGGLGLGGAQPAHLLSISKTIKLMTNLLFLDGSGQLSEKERLSMIRALLREIDQLGESYIPFLRIALNGVEAGQGTRSHKLLTTWFDQKTNRQSALRRNKIERDWVDSFQHALFGREKPKGRR